MEGEKCTDIEKERRIYEVMRKMIAGARRYDLLQYFTKEWEVSVSTIDKYSAEARAMLQTMSKEKLDIAEEFGLAVMQLTDLYAKCLAAKEYNTARLIRRDLSDLTGIRNLKVIESTEKMDQEDVVRELQKLLGANFTGHA